MTEQKIALDNYRCFKAQIELLWDDLADIQDELNDVLDRGEEPWKESSSLKVYQENYADSQSRESEI